jgi:hypothetical protein
MGLASTNRAYIRKVPMLESFFSQFLLIGKSIQPSTPVPANPSGVCGKVRFEKTGLNITIKPGMTKLMENNPRLNSDLEITL